VNIKPKTVHSGGDTYPFLGQKILCMKVAQIVIHLLYSLRYNARWLVAWCSGNAFHPIN